MEIRKGPYGQFAVETVQGKVNKYAIEIISNTLSSNFINMYLSPSPISTELEISYDVTNLKSINSENIENTLDRITFRKAIGDLFLTFLRCMDLLIPLTNINWNTDYIFIDSHTCSIKLLINPCITKQINISLSELGNGQIESILNNTIFHRFLTSDEISKIVFAINNNDESLLEEIAINIKNNDPIAYSSEKTKNKNNNKIRIILAIVCFIFSVVFLLMNMTAIWFILLCFSFFTFITTTNNIKTINEKDNIKSVKLTSERMKILFEEENKSNLVTCLILKSQQQINGEYISKAIYTTKATIGSDKFLSDIYINDISLSPVHVEIELVDSSYFVVDKSHDNTTYIENRKLEQNKKYEIKNDQILRCGNYDFKISIGL